MSITLDKISKLLAKAESTEHEAERDALVSKAQQLATLASIDLEVARQHQADQNKREQPEQRRVELFGWEDRRKQGRHHFVNLFLRIGEANDVKANIYADSTGVVPFGFPSDIDVTEALYASLAVQMVTAANAYLKTGAYKTETAIYEVRDHYWGGTTFESKPMNGKTARSNFYEAFINAISIRLLQARKDAVATTESVVNEETGEESTSGALVLADKAVEVRDFYKQNSNARGSWGAGRRSSAARSDSARSAGTEAGKSARLTGTRGIGGARSAVSA